MYWRTHISKPECRVAVRVGDYKVVADKTLTKFQLFNLAEDPGERTDLAAREPERLEAMRKILLDLDREVLAEGPDWWKDENEY
jgi:arylsulfatase A-like enzyme